MVLIVMLFNLVFSLSTASNYTTQRSAFDSFVFGENGNGGLVGLNSQAESIRSMAESGDLLQQVIGSVINVLQSLVALPIFLAYLMVFILSGLGAGFTKTITAGNIYEQFIWGLLTTVGFVSNATLVKRFIDTVVGQRSDQ